MSGQNEIKGKLALITGASGGIGAACAKELAIYGVNLILTYSSNKVGIDSLVEELSTKHGFLKKNEMEKGLDNTFQLSIHAYQVDLSSIEATQKLFEEIKKDYGTTPDILISNAGYGKRIVNVWDIPVEEFDYTLDINVRASFLLVKGCVEKMRDQRWGRIVFISSIAAHGGGINGCHYAASKGALTSLMKNLATRLGPYNISVNDVAPAMIGDTGMIPNSASVPGVQDTIPLGRLGEPEEVGRAVGMMVRTGYCTGQSLLLAGGLR